MRFEKLNWSRRLFVYTRNKAPDSNANTTILFVAEELRETILDFSQRIVRVL